MKYKITLLFFSFIISGIRAQTYPSFNINLLSHIDPQTSSGGDGRKYSGCWGWRQDSTGREYALVGTADKTYFIEITNPYNPIIRDSVMGRRGGCTWREIKNYKHYCYIVSDDATPNSFQIVDMRYLPDSVHVVHDDVTYFERAHTIWVDGNKLYTGGETPFGGGTINMRVYSLANPAAPLLLRTLNTDYPSINYVHDMFVRRDTIFASAGGQGLHVFKLTGSNTFTALGSLTGYPESGYNHSSFITDNGKTLVFCDETPGKSIKIADVTNLSNITLPALTKPNNNPEFVGHNPYVKGNQWAFVSAYQDGLLLYDISVPSNPILKGFFDTFPSGGANAGNNYNGTSYRGNWGAYPYFQSGVILACDMQNGVFLLEANALTGTTIGVKEENENHFDASIFPNPASNQLSVSLINVPSKNYTISITNMLGQTMFNENCLVESNFPIAFKTLDISNLSSGTYLVKAVSEKKSIQKKIIISK